MSKETKMEMPINPASKENENEVPAVVGNEDVYWEDLIRLYGDVRNYLEQTIQIVSVTGETFKPIIDGDEEITTTFNATTKSLLDFSEELLSILSQHSVTEEKEDGGLNFKPYVGVIDKNNEQHTQVYMSLLLAYNGLMDKVETVINTTQTHLMGLINVAAEKKGFVDKDGKPIKQEENK